MERGALAASRATWNRQAVVVGGGSGGSVVSAVDTAIVFVAVVAVVVAVDNAVLANAGAGSHVNADADADAAGAHPFSLVPSFTVCGFGCVFCSAVLIGFISIFWIIPLLLSAVAEMIQSK